MTALHVLFTIAGISLVAATLPLVLELLVLSLAALFPPRKRRIYPSANLNLFIIIPAHNEERLIANCITSLRTNAITTHNILVIAHNCTDATAHNAIAAGAQVLPLQDNGAGGKGAALHFGFTHALAAGADGVLVIDADSTASHTLIPSVLNALAAGSAAVQCRYEVANPETTSRTRLMALSFLGINVVRPRGRSRLGLSCGIFGNGFALSAATLRRVPYLAHSVVEDLEYHLQLVRSGLRVDFLDDATVFGEMPATSTASSTQRARWEGGRQRIRRQFTWPLLRGVLGGRFRLLEPLLDLRALPLATTLALLVLALLPPLSWLRDYAVLGLVTIVLYVLASALVSRTPARTLWSLFAAPGYLLWKLAMVQRTRLAARKDAAWVRTERND